MGKKDIKVNSQNLFPKLKSYSIDEIMAAGGPTVFAEKIGKSAQGLFDMLAKLPKDAFLTDEEFEAAMKTLNENK